MKNILQTITRLENLIVGVCTESLLITNAFLLFPEHRKLFGCGIDLSCVSDSITQLLLIYA